MILPNGTTNTDAIATTVCATADYRSGRALDTCCARHAASAVLILSRITCLAVRIRRLVARTERSNIARDTEGALAIGLKFAWRALLARNGVLQLLVFAAGALFTSVAALELTRVAHVAEAWAGVAALLACTFCTFGAIFARVFS